MATINSMINFLGFICGLGAGILLIILGIMNKSAAAIAFGVWALISVPLAWFSGAKAEPSENPFKLKLGAKFRYVPDFVWVIIALLFVGAIVIAIVFR
jgi:hypothetical protein